MKRNRKIISAVALVCVLSLICASLFGCGGAKTQVESPVLEYGESAIPLSFYEFLLSRMKGNLARNKYDVKSDSFWDEEAIEGVTYEEYFNSSVLESCKNYLAAVALFDKYDLELPQSTIDGINEEVGFYIDYDGRGSLEDFNALVSKYGIDAEALKEAYIIEAKYQYLLTYLYNGGELISSAVKEEFYQENYYRFKQILVSKFYYEYERDEQGNVIYFDTESGLRLYDKENGSYRFDGDGNKYRDKDGYVIYYDESGNILYDNVNGQPSVILDENGEAREYAYSDGEMAERAEDARVLLASIERGDKNAFEDAAKKHSDAASGDESYPDGYYFSSIESGKYEDYMLDILETLEGMEIGDVAMVESDYGYHIVMRYELDAGKYSDSRYSDWFVGFASELIDRLFLVECGKIIPDIKTVEENLGKARSIRKIGVNYDY